MNHISRNVLDRIWRKAQMVATGLLVVSFWGQGFDYPAHAEPLVRVLFGDDECSFLPERPAPGWISKRPPTNNYVGISSSSNSDRKLNPTEQIQAAEQNARTALAAEIEVVVNETVNMVMEEKNRTSGTTISRESTSAISQEAKQAVDQTLMGARIDERWLDRENCMIHVLATATQASVEDARKKLAERLRRQFKFKQLMLLDRSDAPGEMADATRAHLDALFKRAGNKLVAADSHHSVCADDPVHPACQQPADIIYAGYKVVLDKEGATSEFKRRIYRLSGVIRFKDRLIASFDVACQGTGKVGQDYLIDQQAAKSCFDKAKPIIDKGMEGSE